MHPTVSPHLNADLLDEKYAQWKADPDSVEAVWSAFFEGFELGSSQTTAQSPATVAPPATEEELSFRARVGGLVYAYRTIGHTAAWIDPLSKSPPQPPNLSLDEFGLAEEDLGRRAATHYYRGGQYLPLGELIAELKRAYCDRIGFEFMHIHNREVRNWLRDRIESRASPRETESPVKTKVLEWLTEAETFEHFLHRKFPGEKRFSLEGGEALMVALNVILQNGPRFGVEEIVMGMSHRGRLNVLANFLHKSLRILLYEFAENYIPDIVAGDGDVKYHLGYESVRKTESGEDVAIFLSANPSHLEAVDPVVEGKARARQRIIGDIVERRRVLPLLLHGDAAFAGQGLVAEVFNLSQLQGYRTGGTVHIVINNQIGFTTMPEDARSSAYATDVAKMIEAPILHVNGDHPLDVLFAAELALAFRQEFSRDVVIDMICYRRHGHNEGDEPEFTQPRIYRAIKNLPSTADLYRQRLIKEGDLSAEEADTLASGIRGRMEKEYDELKALEKSGAGNPTMESRAIAQPAYTHDPVATGIPLKLLRHIGGKLTEVPDGFRINDKIDRRFLGRRRKAVETGGSYNWAFAEALAFGSLLVEKTDIRLSGQDSRRGTFSQRHAVLYDVETRERHIPLMHLEEDQGRFCVYNSLLSEAAVLGFDYGYSLMSPEMLILWEAQFGDFANGAQVIVDQFLVSAESKWQRPSSLVMLLPHGYEGMGPEHSSARIERFLQLGAEQNILIANLTTPAQYFHILRRQVKRPFRKPLILMTPKSLLGLPACVSREDEFAEGACFREILDDHLFPGAPEEVNRVIFCSGKIYYDLIAHREARRVKDTAIVRVEQIYPLHEELLKEVTGRYPGARKWVWCQEEPLNMGAWFFMGPRLQKLSRYKVRYAGRDRSSSTAAGAKAIHKHEQNALVASAYHV